MDRREFLAVAGGVVMGARVRATGGRAVGRSQTPSLSPAVFTHRIELLQEELRRRRLDLLVAEPSTNFQYFAGYNPGRSERLILLMLPAAGNPAVVCPSFEAARIKRNSAVSDVRGWEEQDNPRDVVKTVGKEMKPPRRHRARPIRAPAAYQRYLRRHPREDPVRRRAGGRVQEGLQPGPRLAARGDGIRQAVHHPMPAARSAGAKDDLRRRLRPVLHAPPGPRDRAGWPRATLSGGGQRDPDGERDDLHHRARDLPARQVRRADRGRLPHDREWH